MKSSFVYELMQVFAGAPRRRWSIIVGAAIGVYWIGIDSWDFYVSHVRPAVYGEPSCEQVRDP